MARFFVSQQNIRDNRATVLGEELDHLRRVLRLRPGDRVTIFDDTGREHEAVIRSLAAECGGLEIVRSYESHRESSLNLTLALGLTKGDKMDFVVEKATELGVHAIAPFSSIYAVPKYDEKKIAGRTQRWQKIALSAAKQCGRTRLPAIEPLRDFRELVESPRPDALKLLFWEGETHRTLEETRATAGDLRSILIVIGPEGGFSKEEAALAEAFGFHTVHLGPRTLRAETAALAATALVQFIWGDLR